MDKIRILHITQSSGGVKTYLHSFVRSMDRNKFHNVLCTAEDEDVLNGALEVFSEVITIPMQRSINPAEDISGIRRIMRIIKDGRYDIIHVHSSKAGLIGRIGATLAGAPVVIYTSHGFSYLSYQGFIRSIALLWERTARMFFTTHFLATSPSESRRAVEDVGFDPARTAFVFNGITIDEQAERVTAKPTAPVILMMARFHPVKNPMMVVRAAERVLRKVPDCRFVLIGGGYHDVLNDQMQRYIGEAGLGERIVLMNWMDRDATKKYLNEAAVYVSGSRSECFGYSVVESMNAGIPVVGTKIDGTSDIIEDGVTGYLVPSDDDERMADRILSLLNDPLLRQRMGEAGKARVRRLFDVEKNAQLLEQYYHALLIKRQ